MVPTFNSLPYVRALHESVSEAAAHHGSVEILYCDNGSDDGTWQFLSSLQSPLVRCHSIPGVCIGEVRNEGAACSTSEYLMFLDSDCTIPVDYFEKLELTFAESGADAVGCRVVIPGDSSWIARVWSRLHYPSRSSFVDWLNSANFCVRREAFEAVRGFPEDLETGEDAEIGARMRKAGYTLFQDLRLSVLHHRNPESLRSFWEKETWRGLGMFGTMRHERLDKPVILTLLHGGLGLVAVIVLLITNLPLRLRGLIVLALLLTAPTLAVAYRNVQHRRIVAPGRSILLYFVYLSARVRALLEVASKPFRRTP